jgi:GAF domain-containing protein
MLRFFENGLFHNPNGNGDLKTALGELICLAADSAKSTSASLYVLDPNRAVLKPLATFGLPEQYVQACGDVRVGDQCCGRAVQQRKPWIVSDMLEDPLFASAKQAAQVSPIRAGFSVPVIDESGNCLGSLACHYDRPHLPGKEDIERNEIWASMIAHVISRYSGQAGAQPAAVLQKTQRMQQDERS